MTHSVATNAPADAHGQTTPPRTLLFGGTFDPIHHGHLIIARAAAEQLEIPSVTLIPSAVPPHKQDAPATPAHHRLAMTRLAVDGDPLFTVSDIELQRSGPSYTIDTLAHFLGQGHTPETLYWLIGADMLAQLHTWRNPLALAQSCTLVTACRPSSPAAIPQPLKQLLPPELIGRIEHHILPTPLIDISATTLRHRIAHHRAIRYTLPPTVEAYIRNHGLYQS